MKSTAVEQPPQSSYPGPGIKERVCGETTITTGLLRPFLIQGLWSPDVLC